MPAKILNQQRGKKIDFASCDPESRVSAREAFFEPFWGRSRIVCSFDTCPFAKHPLGDGRNICSKNGWLDGMNPAGGHAVEG
ncbi:MAG: hypothetical protein V1822_01035 [Candidatus Micrarchaeota archaeon]